MTAPVGFIVLLEEDGQWGPTWDGQVHPDVDTGTLAVQAARAAGYRALLTAAMPVPGPAGDADGGAA